MANRIDRVAAVRWAVLTVGLAAAVGVSAYWTALASRPAVTEASPAPVRVPIFLPSEPQAPRQASAPARDRAFVRGRREGFREGRRAERRETLRRLAGFGSWSPGAAYVVTAARDGKGIQARLGPLESGASYYLCRGGTRVCVKRRD